MPGRVMLQGLAEALGLPVAALSQVEILGAPVLPSSFRVNEAASAAIAVSGLAAALLWEARGGGSQGVVVDQRHAAAAFQSEQVLRLDGAWVPREQGDIAGLYPTGGGGWVRLHTNFDHHRAAILDLLGCAGDRASVAAVLRGWDAFALEAEAISRGLTISALRDFAAWDAHPHGQAMASLPLVEITRIGDAPAEELAFDEAPLGGLRVLDLTRVIAGPVATRTLAAHGAEVLTITGPDLPGFGIADLGRGKRQGVVDLRNAAGRAALAGLLAGADVFVQGYRPGSLAARGFGPAEAVALRPGLVVAELSAYGAAGPWSGRRGFDSLVQTASGFNAAEAAAFGQASPRPLPVQALDHATGYLLAAGIMTALLRRMREGGSWHVRVSLARTGAWLRGLGQVAVDPAWPVPSVESFADLLERSASGFGVMQAVRHPARLERTPAGFTRPSVPPRAGAVGW